MYKKVTQLNEREEQILKTLIEQHIQTRDALSSGAVAAAYTEKGRSLSSATVRNVLHALEEKGFLEKAHLSAGRIPTRKGFRFYVNQLVEQYYHLEMSPDARDHLSGYIRDISDTRALLVQYLDFLKDETGFMSLLVFPSLFNMRLARVEFVRLSPRRVLMVVTTRSNLYRQVVVDLDRDISYEELISVNRYLNREFFGKTLFQVRQGLIRGMRQRVEQIDSLAKQILSSSFREIERMDAGEDELVVRGMSNLVSREDVHNVRQLQGLVLSVEEKHSIVELINTCMDRDVTVFLSGEIADDYSMIISPYGIGNGIKGAFGLLGPVCMDYRRVFATMRLMTGTLMSAIIQKNMN
ncbi:MAG: heat-inducible transcription repressor HrcA [Acidobacteria bacterium]|nr:MAG: heat-inducible transcription repressor HrcA [Acidobacteriota bacterium]